MCGIAGFYGFRNDKLIHKFSQELSHRGPDGEGFYFSDKVSLLNRRLAIIDRKGGDQPIYNEDKSVFLVYNGEIYNYQELRGDLQKAGHKFVTVSDTEVIVHAYEEWGQDSFDKLNGMFAIALYDIKKDKLFLVRDHFGIKPLYYSFISNGRGVMHYAPTEKNTGIIFSSEISPIFHSGLIPQKPNDKTIYRYLKYRIHDEGKDTFFENINRLLPGEMLVVEKCKVEVKNYSSLKLPKQLKLLNNGNLLDDKTIHEFKEKLITSVKQRLISEVPVGTCLSGGLDSSTIVAIINKLLLDKDKQAESVGINQKTFSAVFPGEINNEEKYIDKVLKSSKNIESFKIKPNKDLFFHELKEFVKTQEEPTISTGPYAQYKVMQKAKDEVTVLLDGQGADEMLAGYLPYYFVYLNELKKEKKWGKFLMELFYGRDVVLKFFILRLKEKLGFSQKLNINKIFKTDFKEKYSSEKFTINNHNLKERLWEDIFQNSLPSLLRYEDRNTMHFSLEGRVPFLDVNLLKFIFNLPDEAIIHHGWNKNILRLAVSDILPELIWKRRNKIGFTTPESSWFKQSIPQIYEIFLSESFSQRIYWEQKEVLRLFWDFIDGKTEDTMFFWRIINLEMWMREFFNKENVRENHNVETCYSMSLHPKIIQMNENKYQRTLIKTDHIKKGDHLGDKIKQSVETHCLPAQKGNASLHNKWFLVISEKIIAISQGRSYFIWDIHPSFWAKFLSSHVLKTKAGIGLGSPFTMQLAINEVGLLRILFGAVLSIITKPLGIKGIFYYVAGTVINQIDGPTEYSLYPSNVSAKLGPKDPEIVVKDIDRYLKENLKIEGMKNYLGSVIIDANDLGQNILGNSTSLDNKIIKQLFKDNPMGQGKEQTPVTLVECLNSKNQNPTSK